MDYLQAVLLGIVQGIAEFLPISSSGHLVIVGELLNQASGEVDPEGDRPLNVALHVGTLGSIVCVYWRDLLHVIREDWRTCLAVIAATLPLVGIAVTPLKDYAESAFESPLIAGCGLLFTAAVLLIGQRLEQIQETEPAAVGLTQAAVIGLFQAMAIVPGISRSGSTISGGLLVGLRRDIAARFSFFIAIPAIAGAAVLTAKDLMEQPDATLQYGPLMAGTITAFVVGWLALRWLLRLISQRRLHWFAAYCGLVGTATIIWQLTVGG